MVAHPRAEVCTHRLQPLNQPRPIEVQADRNGTPIAITQKGRRIAIEGVKDRWRIDDEWWRKEISRFYYQVILRDGRMLTIFHNLIDGGWFTQTSTMPAPRQAGMLVFVGCPAESHDVRRAALS